MPLPCGARSGLDHCTSGASSDRSMRPDCSNQRDADSTSKWLGELLLTRFPVGVRSAGST